MGQLTLTYGFFPLYALVAVSCISLLVALRLLRGPRNPLPLPPGPKRLPILGNVLDVPRFHQWITYADFTKKLNSDILYFRMLGHDVVVLNSLEGALDLLDKRSSLYSDRPRMPMLKELCGWGWATTVVQYGTRWRKHRKALHQYFNLVAAKAYTDLHTLEARKMMRRLLHAPDDFREHIKHMTNTTILRIAYGLKTKEHDDPYLRITEEAFEGVSATGIPGSFLVDVFPSLLYVPSWFPGAGFKRKAKEWYRTNMVFLNVPFEAAKASKGYSDRHVPIAHRILEDVSAEGSPDEVVEFAKHISGMAFIGGSDTTVSTLATFFMAMALYPEVQKKAQAELDAFNGPNRMPEPGDDESLPYIQALTMEALRWQLVLPLAVVHCVTEDDEYRGYHIPRGAVVIGNSWAICHNEKHYPDPHAFKPERFLKDGKLNPDVLDPARVAFGFGRRICPGRHMAMNSLHITFQTILACFNIGLAKDQHGNDIPIEAKMTPGMVSFPEDFKCSITPRSTDMGEKIERSIHAMDIVL